MAQASLPAQRPVEEEPAAAPRGRPLHALGRELRDHLPIWFVYVEAIGLLHAALANFPAESFAAVGIPRERFVPTIAFPLVWFVVYFALRLRARPGPRRWAAALVAVAALGVPLLVTFGYVRHPLRHGQLTALFEVMQFCWVAVFLVQIGLTRGRWALLEFFGVTLCYGLILENTGIVMRYFYEPSFRVYLGPLPAPLATMLGWSLVFYVVISVVEQLGGWWPWLARGPGRQALAATALALCLDAQLDPMASMSGVFWRWNDKLPPGFLGVPLVNFAAWFGAFLPYSWFLFRLRARPDLTPRQRNWELFLRVPLAAGLGGALCFAVMALLEGGVRGPTFQVLAEFSRRLLPY
ncbi:MAG TPA: hypothetical protein VGQ83_07190 [Polyangia bacterium]|jgi:hypothetical protein